MIDTTHALRSTTMRAADIASDAHLLCNDKQSNSECLGLMRWTAPATIIAMCQFAVTHVCRRESPFGREQ